MSRRAVTGSSLAASGDEPAANWFEQKSDQLFVGEVSPWVYAWLRVGLAAIHLIRHSDWLRPWVFLEHYRWIRGYDFLWSAARPPYLESPLIPGLVLDQGSTLSLVIARTALALLLLVGIASRWSAVLLALTSYILLVSDRYHFRHHLHLLYLSIAWLCLAPLGDRLNLWRAMGRVWAVLRRRPNDLFAPAACGGPGDSTPPLVSPLWPLQLLRGLIISVYIASGTSKVNGSWLSGEILEALSRTHMLGGPTWAGLYGVLGYGGVAKLTCLVELALPVLLLLPATRRGAVLGGLAFHILISGAMMVSTFGVQMGALLLAFWPKSRHSGHDFRAH